MALQGWLRWSVSNIWMDAVFLGAFDEVSANHPQADEEGVLHVRRGDRLPGLSRHQLKAALN